MQRNFQIIGVVILIALAGVTLFKLYQEPVSNQIIYLVIAILVAVFILLGLKPKSVKYKDFQIEIDHDTGKRLSVWVMCRAWNIREPPGMNLHDYYRVCVLL